MIQNKIFYWALLFIIIFSFSNNSYAQKKDYAISGQNVYLRNKPHFLGKPTAKAQYGDKIILSKKSGSWYLVKLNDKAGWIHKSSFQDAFYILNEIGKGQDAAKKTYKDEVVAAGKGFSPEYEAIMKTQNPNINYSSVDEIEKWNIGPEKLMNFGTKGGLASEILK